MGYFRVENLDVKVGQFNLQNISFTIPYGEVLVILGSSGSGKSVLLESIAGFNRPIRGQIWLDGHEMTEEPPEKRQIGFMFQDYALFPHLSVEENITFPLRFRHQSPQLRQDTAALRKRLLHRKVIPAFTAAKAESSKTSDVGVSLDSAQIISMLKIEHLLARHPMQLSGGEKQRVAMARALIQQPKLFLLDEPMSALDARTREELREELRTIFNSMGLTAIYVTHDQSEALALADQVCIMNAGHVVQFGTKEEVFKRPLNSFTAKFLGMKNTFPGLVESRKRIGNAQEYIVQVHGLGSLRIILEEDFQLFEPREVVDVGIRPEDILIGVDALTGLGEINSSQDCAGNYRHATITDIFPWGVMYKLHLSETTDLTVLTTKHLVQNLKLKAGDALPIYLPPNSLHIMKTDR